MISHIVSSHNNASIHDLVCIWILQTWFV